MEICVQLHSISQLPDLRIGGTPKYLLATHYGGKDSLLLPSILAPSTLKPIPKRDVDAHDNECPCLSFSNDSSVHMSFSPEEILDGMGLHAKIDSIKSPMNIHPATIDTICTRLINMHLGLDLLVLVPASSVSLLAPKKAAPSSKGQPAEEVDLLCIPISHARIDTSEHIIKALSTVGGLSFLHSTTFVLKNSLLGLFGDVLIGDSDTAGDFMIDACISVTVTMSDFILRKMLSNTASTGVVDTKSRDVTIGTFQFHAINFHGLYNIPGANWTMEFTVPVETDDDGTVRSAIYCTCGGGRVKQAPLASLAQPAAQATKKDQSDLTSEQALEKFERLAAGVTAYMPVSTDLSLSKSNFSGAFSTGRTDIASRHTASSHGVLRDRGKGLAYRLTMDLQEYLLVRDVAGSTDTAAQLTFPDHTVMRQHESLVEYALYVEEILNNYSASISRRIEEYVASHSSTISIDDTRAPRPQSKGASSSRDAAGGSTRSQGASVRFVAEIFEPFLLGARNLLMSRTVLICMNNRTRSLLKQGHSGKKSNEFMLQILLRPSYSLQAKYLLASKAILSEKKPPTAPLVPIANTHSIFAGNAQGMTAFCAQTNLSYGFNRSIIYYTQAPDQPYNRFPCPRPQLQQTRQAFAEPLAAYCYTRINASSILSPVCQYASCDSVYPLLPYDEAIFSAFFPPVVSSWTGVAGQAGIEEDEFEILYNNGVCSEDGSDAASVGRSRPTSAGMDAPIQLRGKANRQNQGSTVMGATSANTSMKAAGASDKNAKQPVQNPLLAEFIGKAARYSNGNPNYIFGNILCGVYSLLETLSSAPLSPVPVQSPSLESLYIVNLINKYCNDMLNMTVVLDTLADLQKIITMPTVFNDSLQSTLSFPLIGASVGFQYPLLANVQITQSARVLTSGAVSESGGSIWPASLRLVRHRHARHETDPSTRLDSSDAGLEGSDDAHQSRTNLSKRDRQHILSYMDTYSMAKERQKTMVNIRRLVDSWRDDITARYKQVCKPLKTEATQQGRTTISYSDIPEENAKMKAIIQAGRQLALRGLQGQILTQNALVTPAILPQISALLTEEKSEVANDYSIKNFKLLIQNEGFVEILSRRILLQLESLAHKGFNNIDDMMEYLLINIVDGEPLDADRDLEKPRVKGYKIQRRIDKDDDDGLSALISSGPRLQNTDRKISLSLTQPQRKSETNCQDSSVLTNDRVRVVGDSISVLFPDVDEEERGRLSTAITNQSNISQDTSYLDGMNSLMIPQHVSLKDINNYLFKAKFLSILGMDDCLELSFKLASATLARQGQLLSNDRKIDIFDTTNIARISKLVSRSNFQIMVSTMLITGTRLSSPHVVRTSTDFERLATYMRGPVGVICACLDSEQSMQLLGTDSCLLALAITKTLFKSAIGTSDTSQKRQGKRGKIVVPLGYDYSEQLLVSALLAYDNFMKYLISKVAGYNVEEVHVWTKNDTQSTVATKLRERKYNKEDVDSMMEILKITPIRNYYSKQFNDLLEGEANTHVVKLPKDATKITAFPSNESIAGSIAGSVAISLYDRQPKRIGDDVSEVGSTLRRNAAGMSATTSVMSGLSGLASEKKAKTISPELQAELDAMPFYNVPGDGVYAYPPFWAMGAYIFVLWSMKLMDARHIARALQTSFRRYIELKQEQYKDEVYFQEHGKHRKTMKDFADDSIGSDVDSGKSCDTTISVDADLVAGVSPSGNNLSCNTTSMNIHGANDAHPSPSLSRLSFEDLKNYKSLKMQKSNYAKQVSINHYSAIQEYLKSDTLDGGMFAPLPYRFKSNAEFMEYVLDSTLPENDKFANPNDPASKNIMRLCAFLSLAEWLSLRGETVISTYATSLADHILKIMITSGTAASDSPFFLHQQLRGIIISMRNMLYERRYAPALEFADSVLRGSLGPALIPKVKACPAFLYLRARIITNMNISLLMKAYDPTTIQASGQLEQSSQYGLSTMLSNDSTRALLNETSRMAIQAYQLASRSKQGGRDDFFRGSTSTYDSYLPVEFLYTIALILFSSINIVGVIRSIFASTSVKSKEASSEEVKQKVDLMFTEVPKYQDTRSNAVDEDDRNLDTLNDFTSLLPLPKPTYSRQPYDITSDATSTQMMYMREQYNANKLIKVQQLKDSKEPVKMSVDLLKELKARAKEVVVDAGGDTELLTSDSRNNSPGHGVVASSANIASMMQQKIQDTTAVDFDNTIAALASATITNRTLTPERTQKDVSRALILASSALKNLILKYPHLGQAWASFSLTQLAMGNVVESRLSSSIATLLAPEAIESWISWVCCELQEIHGIKSSNGTVNQSRIAEVRNYMRQIEAMGVLYTMLRVVWVDICQFASEVLK